MKDQNSELKTLRSNSQPLPRLSKTRQYLYRGLGSAKMRRRRGLFVVEGGKCITDILRRFEIEALLVREGEEINAGSLIGKSDGRTFLVSAKEMAELSEFATPSGVMGIFRLPADEEPDMKLSPDRLYLALDGIRDPGNFGSIVRTADWFGIHTIYASHDCADFFNPKVIQASMGSASNVKVAYTDLLTLVDANTDMPVVGTLLDGENIYRADLPQGAIIVMGNEGKGISEPMRERISQGLLLPPFDTLHGESLNVGAATAAVLALFRQRKYDKN